MTDSDCEIQENEIALIEIKDDDELVEYSVSSGSKKRKRKIDHIYDFCSTETAVSSTSPANNILFRIAFNSENKFNELKDCIVSALDQCLKAKNLQIEFLEDQNFLDIAAIDKTVENAEKPLFMIATEPIPIVAEKELTAQIPSYKRSIKDVLKDSDGVEKKSDDNDCPRPPKSLCFNCSGTHALKDCPLPRNGLKISKARKMFQSKSERYHIDIQQRFAHLKPGKLSENLAGALGLRKGQIPSFFYQMRKLGYPPGWLEDAKVAHSGIALFDSEGRTVLESDEDEGEIYSEKHKYDIQKIHNFPGFNVDPGRGFYDDYKYQNVPPLDPRQSKEKFIKQLGEHIAKQGYKRRKLKIPDGADDVKNNDSINNSVIDMEIENENEEGKIDVNKPQPPPPEFEQSQPQPPPKDDLVEKADETQSNQADVEDDCSSSNNVSCESPTIDILKEKQKQLLEALNSTDSNELPNTEISEISNDQANETTIADKKTLEIVEPNIEANENQADLNMSNIVENNVENRAQSTPTLTNKKFSVLGTPILKFSPYDKLPSDTNWQQGVSDVINFENLPDSTGKYEQMKRVLSKVRRKITKLNSDEN